MAGSTIDLAARPIPADITLLFRYGRSSTVLSLNPTNTIAEAKALLLAVLKNRGITTFPGTNTPLPANPDDLELAITKERRDPRDTSKGWINVEDVQSLALSSKAGKKKSMTDTKSPETIADLELKDGTYVAYRQLKTVEDLVDGQDQSDWHVIVPTYEDEDEEMEDAAPATSKMTEDADDEDEDMDIPIPVPRNAVAK